jgi:predicted HD phosphohydrolase
MGIAGGPAPDPRARAVIAAAFACADTASETWIAGGGHTDIGDLYDRSLAAVRDPG